jgi:hypothetical protein
LAALLLVEIGTVLHAISQGEYGGSIIAIVFDSAGATGHVGQKVAR